MLDQFLQRQMDSAERAHEFEDFAAIISAVSTHPHLDAQTTIIPSGIQGVLGQNPANEELFAKQTDVISESRLVLPFCRAPRESA